MNLERGIGVREADLPWVDIGVRPRYNQRYQGFFDKSSGIAARIGNLYADATDSGRNYLVNIESVPARRLHGGRSGTAECKDNFVQGP